MTNLAHTIRHFWSAMTGQDALPGAASPEVIVHDPGAARPHDLDDPFFDPQGSSAHGERDCQQRQKEQLTYCPSGCVTDATCHAPPTDDLIFANDKIIQGSSTGGRHALAEIRAGRNGRNDGDSKCRASHWSVPRVMN